MTMQAPQMWTHTSTGRQQVQADERSLCQLLSAAAVRASMHVQQTQPRADHARTLCAQAGSRFVLVPSQADGGCGGLLPRPALPAALVRELQQLCPSLVLASNPVRLRWGSQQIALLRCDLVQRLKALSLLPPAGAPVQGCMQAPARVPGGV